MKLHRSEIDFSKIIGQQIQEIVKLNPTLVFLDGSIIIECPWRLRDSQNILLGSYEYQRNMTSDDAYLKLKKLLVGQIIQDVIHYAETSDLVLKLGDIQLDLFHESPLYEGWQLFGPNGFLLVATPGGSFVFFEGCK